jgi:hypothetical protein
MVNYLQVRAGCPRGQGQTGGHPAAALPPARPSAPYLRYTVMITIPSNQAFCYILQVHSHDHHSIQSEFPPPTTDTQSWSPLLPTRPSASYHRFTVMVPTPSNRAFCFIPQIHSHGHCYSQSNLLSHTTGILSWSPLLPTRLLLHTTGTQSWSPLLPTRPSVSYHRYPIMVTAPSNQAFCFIPQVHSHGHQSLLLDIPPHATCAPSRSPLPPPRPSAHTTGTQLLVITPSSQTFRPIPQVLNSWSSLPPARPSGPHNRYTVMVNTPSNKTFCQVPQVHSHGQHGLHLLPHT